VNLTVEIPDDLARRLGDLSGGDLSRRALEALAVEEYRSGHLTETELQRLLGFGTRYKLDGFLKAHNILVDDYSVEELHREVETLQRLGF
jgi:predicted HTH domain antitoxin